VETQARPMRVALAFAVGVLTAAALGSIAQTQINLAAIEGLSADVPLAVRMHTTVEDLLGFGPLYAAIVAAAFLVAMPLASFIGRRARTAYLALHALAGAAAILAAILLINAVLPMTPIAATRHLAGTAALALAGAIGGLVYGVLRGRL
jgi:hypothetical protein